MGAFKKAVIGAAVASSATGHSIHKRGTVPADGTIWTSCVTPGTVALTFDDGPHIYTQSIVDALTKAGHKATFFQNGQNYGSILDYGPLLQSMIAGGHQVASHTWAHADLATLDAAGVTSQMKQLEDAHLTLIGKAPTYMRPPYLSLNDNAVTTLKGLGYKIISVDIDTQDWDLGPKGQIATSLQWYEGNQTAGGTLSLNHDVYQPTADTFVPAVIEYLASKGLKSVPVGECIGDDAANWYRGGSSSASSALPSASSKAPSSATSGAPKPSGTSPSGPGKSDTPKPSGSAPSGPAESGKPGEGGKPGGGDSGKPGEGGDSGKPSGGDSGKPSGGDSGKPSGGDSGKPSGGDSGKPSGGDSGKPSGGDSGKPSGGDSGKPSGGDSGKPSGGDSGKPSGGKPSGGDSGYSPSTGPSKGPACGGDTEGGHGSNSGWAAIPKHSGERNQQWVHNATGGASGYGGSASSGSSTGASGSGSGSASPSYGQKPSGVQGGKAQPSYTGAVYTGGAASLTSSVVLIGAAVAAFFL